MDRLYLSRVAQGSPANVFMDFGVNFASANETKNWQFVQDF
jgi:hypothetical protein